MSRKEGKSENPFAHCYHDLVFFKLLVCMVNFTVGFLIRSRVKAGNLEAAGSDQKAGHIFMPL